MAQQVSYQLLQSKFSDSLHVMLIEERRYIVEFISQEPERDVLTFLLTAAAIGMLFKRGATISAAEGGCMAEGQSSSMSLPEGTDARYYSRSGVQYGCGWIHCLYGRIRRASLTSCGDRSVCLRYFRSRSESFV